MMLPPISGYLLMNGIGLITALLLLDRNLRTDIPERHDYLYVMFVLSVVAGWAGAHFFDMIVRNKSLGVAGFTFYGGAITGAIFFFVFVSLAIPVSMALRALDVAIVPFVLAHAIGRIGCFLSGCCYGRLIVGSSHRHPTQLYESAFLFLLALFLSRSIQNTRLQRLNIYLIVYPIFRFTNEYFRGDDRGNSFLLTPSQWASLLLLTAGCLLFAFRQRLTRQWSRRLLPLT